MKKPHLRAYANSFLTFVFACCISVHGLAQLYSSGNNVIGGNKVGISTNNPQGALDIFIQSWEPCYQCMIGTNYPALRFTTDRISGSTTTTHVWDLTPEAKFSLTHKIGSGSVKTLLEMDDTETRFKTNYTTLSDHIQFSAPTVNSSVKFQMGLGLKYNGSSWTATQSNQKGAYIQSDGSGVLKFFTGVTTNSNGTAYLTITDIGRIGIGTTTPSEDLEIAGNVKVAGGDMNLDGGDLEIKTGRILIKNSSNTNEFSIENNGYVRAREVKVDADVIPDYVFEPEYGLMPLDSLKSFVETHRHLPNIRSAAEYQDQGGVELGELSLKLLEKQEELLLYILQLEARIKELEDKNSSRQ